MHACSRKKHRRVVFWYQRGARDNAMTFRLKKVQISLSDLICGKRAHMGSVKVHWEQENTQSAHYPERLFLAFLWHFLPFFATIIRYIHFILRDLQSAVFTGPSECAVRADAYFGSCHHCDHWCVFY